MNRQEFQALLEERILVCDGAMGTRLYDQGIGFDHSFDELCVVQPDLIRSVHQDYVTAGADLLLTNSFGANRIRLSHWGFEKRAAEFAGAAARLAREVVDASDRNVLVAGSVGPLGAPLAPIGRIKPEEAFSAFTETAEALIEGGVDLLLLETFVDQREISEALRAVREISADIPVIGLMSFTDEGKTLYGNKPEEVARGLMDLGADVVGANCSVGPQGLLDVIDRMLRVPDVRLFTMPNAGLPQLVGGRYLYLSSPEYMADYALEFVQRGVRIVGGCCGTGVDHVEAMVERVGGMAPVQAEDAGASPIAYSPIEVDESAIVFEAEARRETSLRQKLVKGEYVVSVEIDPPRGVDASKLIKGAATCKAHFVDAINIADSPLARARMSPLALGTLIRENVDLEIILHVSCRDRNLLGLQSEAMGAYALGIRNLLCVTGDPPQMGDYPDATGVFDVDAIGLVSLLKRLNDGVDLASKKIDYKTDFFLGVASNPTAVDLELESQRFQKKLEAGAQFTMTQPLYEEAVLDQWLEANSDDIPLLVGILPLRNGRHAEFLHNEVPGMSVPENIRKRMHEAGDEGAAEGVRIAQEFLMAVKDRTQGVYLMPPFNRFEMAVEVIEVL